MSILSVREISKNYGVIHALKKVSFDVPPGSVFGILGPNGSGKTTLLGIVMDVLRPSSGSYLWNDKPADNAIRKNIGTLLETPNFYHYLSGADNLAIAAAIKGKGKENIDKVLEAVNLLQRKNSKFSTYSLGMKQRLAIASTLLGDPEILVFDEPTNGLDPAGIAEIRELIKQLSFQGKTIIMASHILDEVEKVCTHVAIIQKGVLKTSGTVSQILSHGSTANVQIVEVTSDNMSLLSSTIKEMVGVESVIEKDGVIQLTTAETVLSGDINRYCFSKGIVLNSLQIKRKTLESTFLEITGTQSDR
ncbi:MAG: ABC transporter ATP-binding protein [Chitinophagaceae bacterium]|nr:ABC transporter ATP-binding protein [Chitinophagaceae bacterium]